MTSVCEAVISSLGEMIAKMIAAGEPLCSVYHPKGCSACNPQAIDFRLQRWGDGGTMKYYENVFLFNPTERR